MRFFFWWSCAHTNNTNVHITRRTGQERRDREGQDGEERHDSNNNNKYKITRELNATDANRFFSRSILILIYSVLLSYPGASLHPTNRPQDADRPRLESIASGEMTCCRRRPALNRNTVASFR
jgi:hypothetical protein